jgi:signal transduction histidine kinase
MMSDARNTDRRGPDRPDPPRARADADRDSAMLAAQRDPARLVHELSNLLDGSLRNVGLALGRLGEAPGASDEQALRELGAAERSLCQMAGVLRDWRDGADATPCPDPQATLMQVIQQVQAIVAPMAHERRIGLTLDIEPAAADCSAGPLFSVIHNAVRNALEAGAPGGHVWIEAELVPGDGGTLELRIVDDGAGIDPALGRDRDGLVEAGGTTKRGQGPHGLGLAICRDIVRGLGGVIRRESRDAGGMVLLVRVPRAGGGASDE